MIQDLLERCGCFDSDICGVINTLEIFKRNNESSCFYSANFVMLISVIPFNWMKISVSFDISRVALLATRMMETFCQIFRELCLAAAANVHEIEKILGVYGSVRQF